jgi:1-deoxy-D-xylulose-5-phosphate synthase
LDENLLHEVFSKFDKVITVEDGCLMGGMGSAILEFMVDQGYNAKVQRLGIPDKFIHHGTQQELYKDAGFDADSIIKKSIEMLPELQAEMNREMKKKFSVG